MEKAIEITGLTKNYGKHRGVRNISLQVEKGDIFGFLGPNGAGKSTTIRSILGLLHFEQGEIEVLGLDSVKQHKELLGRIGYMPSEAMFYPTMKVRDVIQFAADVRRCDCKAEAEKICEIMELNTGKKIEELSLGNRKKVSIVCAMQHKPELLILDEPTSGLDPLMQEAFFHLILDYNRRGATCFLSSHVLTEVKRYCKNAAIIREGEIIRVDTVENLSKSNLRKVRVWEAGKEKSFSYTGNMKELIRKLNETELSDVLIEEPGLDELFMHYYSEADTGEDREEEAEQ